MYAHHAPIQGTQWASGLHVLHLPASAQSHTSEHVWHGDARSCCSWAGGQGLAVGTEPADVFVSRDGGRSWSAGAAGFATVPSRSKWTFPAPPHEPHVLSIEHLGVAEASSESASHAGQLVAGIEVGGVLVSDVGSSGSSEKWEEHSEGLYVDVHSCRIDPFQAQHWLAVTGELWGPRLEEVGHACMSLVRTCAAHTLVFQLIMLLICVDSVAATWNTAGRGLYATRDAGQHWEAQGSWSGRYTVGLAFNPGRKVTWEPSPWHSMPGCAGLRQGPAGACSSDLCWLGCCCYLDDTL